ncbi:hypothetical protein L6452_30762 [Arctium lappa]|uniref:Uncharacterized protein n=1 Tax=Arctium lappa TaxID=4217 RepID=A0ACB8ZJI8_ARCLA|nr:hypothetical protein L6452_30762 [Arctium lappa]
MTPSKNYRDAYDDVDEEFSIVILHQNDNIMPRVDPLDLGKESRDDYFRTDYRGHTATIFCVGFVKDANGCLLIQWKCTTVVSKQDVCSHALSLNVKKLKQANVMTDNSLSPICLLLQIKCVDHKGFLYDIMGVLKDIALEIQICEDLNVSDVLIKMYKFCSPELKLMTMMTTVREEDVQEEFKELHNKNIFDVSDMSYVSRGMMRQRIVFCSIQKLSVQNLRRRAIEDDVLQVHNIHRFKPVCCCYCANCLAAKFDQRSLTEDKASDMGQNTEGQIHLEFLSTMNQQQQQQKLSTLMHILDLHNK